MSRDTRAGGRISRILVSGRVSICREVFGDTLNESRDPDRGTSDRYSARFYLKHSFIEHRCRRLVTYSPIHGRVKRQRDPQHTRTEIKTDGSIHKISYDRS